MGERDTDWERAHLRVERNEWRIKMKTHLIVGVVWGRKTPTERERN